MADESAAPSSERPPAAPSSQPMGGGLPIELQAVDVPGWSRWTKQVKPIFSGPFNLIGDPSVVRDGAMLRMFYTCYAPKRKGPAICQATSTDGQQWTDVPISAPLATALEASKGELVSGLMVAARPGRWDDAHETSLAFKYQGEYLLYFAGYRDKGGFFKSFPAWLGLATSTNGVDFKRASDEPVMKPTPRWYDNDAVFSPSIVEYDGRLVMVYTGHCWNDCPLGKGVFLLAASSTDGRTWTKHETPVMTRADLPQTKDGAAESDLVKGPDGFYYLFMSLLYGDDGHEIGIARSATPYGPWDIAPTPIIRKSKGQFDEIGPIAPSVLIEGNRVRMWYHGFGKKNTIQIGYAEATWPLRLK